MGRERLGRTASAALKEARRRLSAAGIASARLDAEVLLAHCLRTTREALLVEVAARREILLDESARSEFLDLVGMRISREPVAYLVGHKEFWSLDMLVTPAVLIPRPETEHLVERALAILPPAGRGPLSVIDVGTGSGAIAVALAHERPDVIVAGVDLSAAALQVARANARRHGVEARVHLVQADLLAPFDPARRHDVVVSNPPYLRGNEEDVLMPDVRDYEPRMALFDDEDGGLIARLVDQASGVLRDDGWLLMEVATQRSEETLACLSRLPQWRDVGVEEDLAGLPRVVRARRRARR
ncbi:MAG: peptide chain release factor N(5)-glutamine methyltransferase [Acidobacteriota bacterium]